MYVLMYFCTVLCTVLYLCTVLCTYLLGTRDEIYFPSLLPNLKLLLKFSFFWDIQCFFFGDTRCFFGRYKFFWGNSLRNFSRSLPFPQTTGKNADLKGEKNPRKAEFLQCKSVRSPHSRECPKIVLFSGMPKNNPILRNAQQKVLFSGMPQKIVLFSGMPKNTSIAEFL